AQTRQDPAAAEQRLTHLIEDLRRALPAMRSTGSTLGRELALARAYLSIMQFRMGPRLQFSVEAAADLLGRDFPPTIIGTLIENAIKHGLEPAKAGGRIDVRAWRDAGSLVVEVADTGVGFLANSGGGVGLANARERLAMLYGAQAELDLTLNEPTGVVARARVPLTPPPPNRPMDDPHNDGPSSDRPAA
ncbi:MAG: sensor histidine kinase, partial [Betaproteobacteria bacterium]